MAKFEKKIVGNFEEVINKLQNNIMNSGMSMNLVDESNFGSGDSNIAVRVYDKYFMRNGNRASLSLTVVGHGSDIFISAIGAEDELVDIVRFCIEQMK